MYARTGNASADHPHPGLQPNAFEPHYATPNDDPRAAIPNVQNGAAHIQRCTTPEGYTGPLHIRERGPPEDRVWQPQGSVHATAARGPRRGREAGARPRMLPPAAAATAAAAPPSPARRLGLNLQAPLVARAEAHR